jgi:hypothetical protein
MTTLEQQIAHLKNYWNVPQEDIDKLMELVIKDYCNKELIRKKNLLYELVNKMKTDNIHNEETDWGNPEGEEIW